MRMQKIIDEIEEIRKNDIEEGTYMSATLEWMDENDIKITESNITNQLPSFIVTMIKEEAFEECLVKPSHNPRMVKGGNNDIFAEMFF